MQLRRALLVALLFAVVFLAHAPARAVEGYTDTPLLPGGKWHVHDPNRPLPEVVEPVAGVPGEQPAEPPSDAIVLFDGKDLGNWRSVRGGPAQWKIEDGALVVGQRTGDIQSKQQFGDCQLHIEFATPTPAQGKGQGRGNSGVFLMGRYEIQVLDSYQNETYADGGAAAIYGQYPPLANASRPPGAWQAYDIAFTAPRFEEGKLKSPAYLTVFHNGVLVQNHQALLGPMTFRGLPEYEPHGDQGPLRLQDHGNPVRFRNIWVRPLKRQEPSE